MRYILFVLLSLMMVMPVALAQASDEPVIYLTPQNQNQQVDDFVDSDDTDDSPIVIQNVTPSEQPLASTRQAKHIAAIKPHVQLYGPTTPQDHIWHLAEKLRPNTNIPVPQMIIALQQANPNAFTGANINALKNGQKLRIPTLTEIQLVDPQLAAEVVTKENLAWQKQNAAKELQLIAPKAVAVAVAVKNNSAPAKNCMTSLCGITANKANNSAKSIITLAPKPAPKYVPLRDANAVLAMPNKTPVKLMAATQAVAAPKPAPVAPTKIATLMPVPPPASSSPQITPPSLIALPVPTVDLKAEQQIRHDEKLIAALQQQLAKKNNQTAENVATTSSFTMLLPKTKVGWWIATLAVFLVVLLWLPSPRRNKQNKVVKVEERREPTVTAINNDEETELEKEYDFMNSDEALPAKLDLANAYIAMEDFQSAEQVLQEVLIKGNETERKAARQLLKKVVKIK